MENEYGFFTSSGFVSYEAYEWWLRKKKQEKWSTQPKYDLHAHLKCAVCGLYYPYGKELDIYYIDNTPFCSYEHALKFVKDSNTNIYVRDGKSRMMYLCDDGKRPMIHLD